MPSIHNDRMLSDLPDELNESQKRAVSAALNKKRLFVTIQGPPRTGKTKVVADLVRQLYMKKQKALICAPSHVAVDKVMSEVLKCFEEPIEDSDISDVQKWQRRPLSAWETTNDNSDINKISENDVENYEEDLSQEHSQGRSDLRMEEDGAELSLHDCVSNGIMDMNKAARILLRQKINGTYNQQIYDEFVHSEAALRVRQFRNEGLLNLTDHMKEMRLNSFLMSEIQCAKFDRMSRLIELGESKWVPQENGNLTLSLDKCTREWTLNGPSPFITITEPAQCIQEYSLRLNEKGGRDMNLKDLPEIVETTLLDFGEDAIGYGHTVLKSGAVNASRSSFFANLGESAEERAEAFDRLTSERIVYRRMLFKALQTALRDIRAYGYDTVNGKWKASDRKRSDRDLTTG